MPMRDREWELELSLAEMESELEELESELEFEATPALTSRKLLEFRSQGSDFFARISGFDPGSATSRDPDVVDLHKRAIKRIASEIVAATKRGLCVDVTVLGREDFDSDPTPHNITGERRADAIADQIGRLLPAASRDRVLSIAPAAPVSAGHAFFDSTTHANRALNRRVDVAVNVVSC